MSPFLGDSHHKEKKTFRSTPGKPYEERINLHLAGLAGSKIPEHRPGEQSGRYRHMPALSAKHTLFTIQDDECLVKRDIFHRAMTQTH